MKIAVNMCMGEMMVAFSEGALAAISRYSLSLSPPPHLRMMMVAFSGGCRECVAFGVARVKAMFYVLCFMFW